MKSPILLLGLLFTILASCSKSKTLAEDTTAKETAVQIVKDIDLNYSLEQLDNTKGLSNSSINCIFQDSQNLIWIGTWDGLNRYDGNSFKIFRPEPDKKNTLSNQVILKIGEDSHGKIWILTMHGINSYDKKTDSIRNFYFLRDNKPPMSESEFNMALDNSKQVYCAVKDWGIGYFDGKSFQHLEGQDFNLKAVKKIEFSGTGELMVLSEDEKLHALTIQKTGTERKKITQIRLVSQGIRTFEVLPDGSVCTVSSKNEAVIMTPYREAKTIPGKSIRSIIGHLPDGVLLAGRSGYFLVDFNGNEITRPWSKYLKNQKITTLVQGSENVIWTGTDGDGIFKMYPLKKSFNLVSKTQLPGLDGGIVRAFLKDGEKAFWIGTKGKGLFRLPADFYANPEKALTYTTFNENNNTLNNAVYALSKGNDELIFIGTDGDGISVYDPLTSRMVGWKDIEGSENCAFFKSTYAIYHDENGFTWLGTNGYGMIRCQINRDEGRLRIIDFKQYLAGNKGSMLSSNIIFSIVPKDDRHLWIGTRLGGLNLFDKNTEKFRAYKNIPEDPGSLSNDDILCLVTDAENKLWIGTSFGLNVLESLNADNTASFKSYTVNDGLPNNTIHGIVTDQKSNLWLSTNFGLSNFAINSGKFINYSRNEGLQNNEFADGAFYRDVQSGIIFMGGIKGFNYFLPEKIKESSVMPDLLIDRISGQNQPVPYYQGLVISPDSEAYPSIILKHNQNFFDIHLSALTYINNDKCQYAYELRGFDNGWNEIGNRKIISFTNVPRGQYSLYLKWSNADGVWSEPVHAFDIRIKPVWWQSDLATITYLILGVLFLLFVRSYYLKRQSLQQNILFRQKEEELHENRLTFFTNIAHEFLTPLTLIVGPVQKLSEAAHLDERQKKFTHMIHKNVSRLLFLTQQLLEFRKAEYEYLEVTVRQFDMVSLVEQVAELFDDWALDKNINYNIKLPSSLPGWFDKDKLEKILFNLMSNAFKYTPANGAITLECQIEDIAPKKLKIRISNTGKGIPKEKLDSLFDRFFLSDANEKSDTEMFRTGIGLAYIKRLVTVLRGEILVTSIPNAETEFTILIPCERADFTDKEIDPETAPVLISHHLKNILEETEDTGEVIPDKISAIEQAENKKKKVLVVEDEKEIHLYLKDLLAGKYKILAAYNGIEALEIIENELPDIIISDVMMPLMDGVELCKKVKTDIRTCHIPFIMLTAKNSVMHRIEGLESGANSYIPKPFYPDHLLVRIQKLLEEKELILKHFTQDSAIEDLSSISVNNDEKAFIKSVIDLIRKNIESEHLDNAYIEKNLGISSSQLYRKTKEIFGLSPGDLIRTIRLKHAAELLRKNLLTVSEVCYKSGFNNRSYFYREFKKMYNTTPKNYQLQYKSRSITFSNN